MKYADGSYRTINTPTQDDIAEAVIVYMGGHVFTVDENEAVALMAAGYEVEEL